MSTLSEKSVSNDISHEFIKNSITGKYVIVAFTKPSLPSSN